MDDLGWMFTLLIKYYCTKAPTVYSVLSIRHLESQAWGYELCAGLQALVSEVFAIIRVDQLGVQPLE